MGTTKKEWQNMNFAEKFFEVFVRVGVLIIGAILPYFAYFVSPETSYPAVWIANDPVLLDVFCWTIYATGIFMLSGLYTYLPGVDDDQEPWKNLTTWSVIGAAGAVLAMILI